MADRFAEFQRGAAQPEPGDDEDIEMGIGKLYICMISLLSLYLISHVSI